MGGGDLNLKKSWHPLLMKNQERVWKQEKAAIDERKRTQQLLKEQAEERQIQELQRLGGKVDDRVEWLYNAAGSSGQVQNNEDMEAYLLGKKSVEGLFKQRDEEKMKALKQGQGASSGETSAAASGSGFQAAGQNPNSIRDLASKVREDPLLAIKKQEQAAYEQLMKDPKRLAKLREERQGKKSSSSKKDKHKDKSDKKHKHHRRDRDEDDHYRRRDDRDGRDYERSDRHRRNRSTSRSRSPPRRSRREDEYRSRRDPHEEETYRPRASDRYDDRPRSHSRRDRSPPPVSRPSRPPPQPSTNSAGPSSMPNAEERLKAMTQGAVSLEADRTARLAQMREADTRDAQREEQERMLRKGGVEASFVRRQKEDMWEKNIAER